MVTCASHSPSAPSWPLAKVPHPSPGTPDVTVVFLGYGGRKCVLGGGGRDTNGLFLPLVSEAESESLKDFMAL